MAAEFNQQRLESDIEWNVDLERRGSHASLLHIFTSDSATSKPGLESILEQNLIILEQNLTYLVYKFYFIGIFSEKDVAELHESSDEEQCRVQMEILKRRITEEPFLLKELQQILQAYNEGAEDNVTNKGFNRSLSSSTMKAFANSMDVCGKKLSRNTFSSIQFSSHCSKTTVGHRGATIRGEGVQLRIPPNSIKKGYTTNISVRGCLNGPFKLPESVELISPIFQITCEPHIDFQCNITLTIHHFANLQSEEECKNIILLTSPEAPTEDEDGQQIWELRECECHQQPQCFPKFTHGEVSLKHFSFECFGMKKKGKQKAAILFPFGMQTYSQHPWIIFGSYYSYIV